MPTDSSAALQSAIDRLAARFADDVLTSLGRAPLADVLSAFARTSRPERRVRATRDVTAPKADRSDVLRRVVAHLANHREGLGAEELRAAMRLAKVDFTRAARDGLATGEIRKEGRLRATRYFPSE